MTGDKKPAFEALATELCEKLIPSQQTRYGPEWKKSKRQEKRGKRKAADLDSLLDQTLSKRYRQPEAQSSQTDGARALCSQTGQTGKGAAVKLIPSATDRMDTDSSAVGVAGVAGEHEKQTTHWADSGPAHFVLRQIVEDDALRITLQESGTCAFL